MQRDLIRQRWSGYPAAGGQTGATNVTIRNGLYHITAEMLDGVQGERAAVTLW
jgi:hypothetical protein